MRENKGGQPFSSGCRTETPEKPTQRLTRGEVTSEFPTYSFSSRRLTTEGGFLRATLGQTDSESPTLRA